MSLIGPLGLTVLELPLLWILVRISNVWAPERKHDVIILASGSAIIAWVGTGVALATVSGLPVWEKIATPFAMAVSIYIGFIPFIGGYLLFLDGRVGRIDGKVASKLPRRKRRGRKLSWSPFHSLVTPIDVLRAEN